MEETDEHGMHTYDRSARHTPADAPFLEQSMLTTAKLWDTLNPHATAQARQRLVQKIAAGLGVCLIL